MSQSALPPDWLAIRSATNTAHRFLCLGDERLTFGDIEDMVVLACEALRTRVPEARAHHAAIWNTEPKSTVVLLLACARLGWTATILNPKLPPEVLGRHVCQVPLTLLLCSHNREPGSDYLREFDGAVEPVTIAITSSGTEPSAADPHPPVRRSCLDRTQGWVFTSGATGTPKAIAITFGNLLWSAVASSYRLGYSRRDCWLHCMPLHHIGGLALLFRSLLFGFSLHMCDHFDPYEVRTAMERGTITHAALVPTMLVRLLDAGLDLTTSRQRFGFVLAGGAKATASLRAECGERGLRVVPSYGMTETCSHIAATGLGPSAGAGEGPVLHHAEIQIRTDAGIPAPVGNHGSIWIRGPQVSPSGETDSRGWFQTDDWGFLDKAGSVHVVDRRDGVFVSGGENVSSRRVAECLTELSEVEQAWVTGIPDREWGHRVVALVQRPADRKPNEDTLRQRCRTRLAAHEIPKRFIWVASLPRTELGKVDTAAARKLVAEGLK